MNRRSFMQLLGAAVTLTAGGIALIDAAPKEIIKSYFLPPKCGWNAGTWELACATEALRIVSEKLGDHQIDNLTSLLARHSRLTERVDKLARGWTPYRQLRTGTTADGTQFTIAIHGGRSTSTIKGPPPLGRIIV